MFLSRVSPGMFKAYLSVKLEPELIIKMIIRKIVCVLRNAVNEDIVESYSSSSRKLVTLSPVTASR